MTQRRETDGEVVACARKGWPSRHRAAERLLGVLRIARDEQQRAELPGEPRVEWAQRAGLPLCFDRTGKILTVRERIREVEPGVRVIGPFLQHGPESRGGFPGAPQPE